MIRQNDRNNSSPNRLISLHFLPNSSRNMKSVSVVTVLLSSSILCRLVGGQHAAQPGGVDDEGNNEEFVPRGAIRGVGGRTSSVSESQRELASTACMNTPTSTPTASPTRSNCPACHFTKSCCMLDNYNIFTPYVQFIC